jgi:CubicO group peptidase (beta-lactamase class C family)
MRSVRKSFLSALFGIAVAEGRLRLSDTLSQLDIDDEPLQLTDAEKQATVRDLLMSRSGIYHPAAYETADIRQNRPARGSHAPGSFWFYNNWDFNALGTIYRKMTGEDIFSSFERHIARPIGMEDYSTRDGQYVFERQSAHPAYPFSVSTRDAARFGLLFANGGRWGDRQIIPTAWIKESTQSYSVTDKPGRGYGYLWWTLPADKWGRGAVIAAGYGGQSIVVVPSKRLVAVQTVDLYRNPKGARITRFLDFVENMANTVP